ncbi:MAG: hypothetical protein CVU10_07695 [Bacteroidetes bacterium HGW-Bacteroidetes-5]|jgi:broad-specificity NMP kinase|nr:MAG: hypothetical protein CVU10_07695 [Bacteroidetes bacterium HGW-Bacteroidetes-5]
MIIIINGSVGIGKTTIASGFQKKFDKSIMLDGDFIGAVHPFKLYDNSRIQYLYDTLEYIASFHLSNGYKNLIINYIFESEKSLNSLLNRLQKFNLEIRCFFLECTVQEQIERIKLRNRERVLWELKRAYELNAILEKATRTEYIGEKVDISGKTINETVNILWELVK